MSLSSLLSLRTGDRLRGLERHSIVACLQKLGDAFLRRPVVGRNEAAADISIALPAAAHRSCFRIKGPPGRFRGDHG